MDPRVDDQAVLLVERLVTNRTLEPKRLGVMSEKGACCPLSNLERPLPGVYPLVPDSLAGLPEGLVAVHARVGELPRLNALLLPALLQLQELLEPGRLPQRRGGLVRLPPRALRPPHEVLAKLTLHKF